MLIPTKTETNCIVTAKIGKSLRDLAKRQPDSPNRRRVLQ